MRAGIFRRLEWRVRVYPCDGRGLNEWFWDIGAGKESELTSDEEWRIEG